jgi:hypothetical protein
MVLIAGPLMALSVGCSKGGPQFATASGIVTLDGKPVAEAGVMFTPVQGGPVASGTTDENGRFSLRTLSTNGALIGEHQVSVTKGRTEEKRVPNATVPLIRYISELPERYARRETSGLTANVSPNGKLNDFTLGLTTK